MTRDKSPILIVDDEPDVLLSLTGLLRRDFKVHTANSGAEALQILGEHPVHVVMTDQRMPEMTGVELMRQTRTLYPDIIRIVFTGYADTRAVVDAINEGDLYRYITKPWDADDLIEVLHQATARHKVLHARTEILSQLESYLDQAARLAAAPGSDSQDSDSIASFLETTKRLRDSLTWAEVDRG